MTNPLLQPDETGNVPSPFAYLNPESRDWIGADEDDNDGEYECDEDFEEGEDDEESDGGWGLGVIGIPIFPIFPFTPALA